MGNVASDVWEGIKDVGEWGVNAVGDVAEWTIDNIPGADIAADIGGVFADVALAPVKLGGKVMDEVAKLEGFEWADDAFGVVENVLEEVNSNASPFHMAAYAAKDAKTLKDAIRTKQKIEASNKAIERANAAEDAEEKAKHLRYLLRGKGNASKGLAKPEASKGAKNVTGSRSTVPKANASAGARVSGKGAASRGAV